MSNTKLKEYPNFVTHMECSLTGETYKAATVRPSAGRPLLVRYNLEELSKSITKDELALRKAVSGDFYIFHKETKNVISLGEVTTPLMSPPGTSKRLKATENLLVKDEGGCQQDL